MAETQKEPQKKERHFPIITVCLLALVLLTIGGAFIGTKFLLAHQYSYTLNSLATEKYQSIFLSTFDITKFSAEDFVTYRGISTSKQNYVLESVEELNEAFDTAFSSGNNITNVYLGLDPLEIWHSEKDDIARVQSAFESGWLTWVDANPEIEFEILLPFQSMEYWLALSEGDLNASFILYQQMIGILESRSNITIYYVGGQDWLINNPGNYLSDYAVNEVVAQKIFLLTFCDHTFQINTSNMEEMLRQTQTQILACKESPLEYPDFSNWEIVFLGDSILGNYEGSISIPGVVNGLSGATVFNCAQGGTSAAEPEPGIRCFPSMAQDFISGTVRDKDSTYGKGIDEFQTADHSGHKLCFVINYGVNDYFGGHPLENPADKNDVSTYAGAMRTAIAALQERYPSAVYVIMGPGQTTYFEDGTEVLSDNAGTMEEYYKLSVSLAEELELPYIDLYQGFPGEGTDLSSVLADGCHYNEYGRYLLGIQIIDSLSGLLQ